jgi:ribosomal protein S18 acetylase RimI-like enzyme
LAGFVHVLIHKTPDVPLFVPRRFAMVNNLAVHSDRRGRGIGRALMDAAHAWILEQGVVEVELGVWEFNEGARRFYEGLGYETIQRRMGKRLQPQAAP